MKTMRSSIVDGVLIAVHTAYGPTDDEWRSYLHLYESHQQLVRANLVVTRGGGPNAKQREAMSKLKNLRAFATAVVSDSVVARGIVTAISWIGKPIRAFTPSETDLAFEYLGVATDTRAKVRLEVAALKSELEG